MLMWKSMIKKNNVLAFLLESALHMFQEVCIKIIVREREKENKIASLITNPIYMLTRQRTYTI